MGGGGSPCHIAILINGNVAGLRRLFFPISQVEFKKRLCPMSLYFYTSYLMSPSLMSHVEFKKKPCRPVDFRGKGKFDMSKC